MVLNLILGTGPEGLDCSRFVRNFSPSSSSLLDSPALGLEEGGVEGGGGRFGGRPRRAAGFATVWSVDEEVAS